MEAETGASESTYSTGDGLLLLMGLRYDCRVLVVGEKLAEWRHIFRNTQICPHLFSRQFEPGSFDLILYHSSSAVSSKVLRDEMKQAHLFLTEHGSLLLFAENIRSFSNLKLLLKLQISSLTGKPDSGLSVCKQALAHAGFKEIRHFIPLPGLNNVEELVAAGTRELELPHNMHPLLRVISKMGFARHFVDGFILFGGAERLESSDLFGLIKVMLSMHSDFRDPQCVLERLDIRLRGALVLFISEITSSIHFIVRVVSDRSIDAIVSKNHVFLEYLHADIGTSSAFVQLLPKPVSRMEYSGSSLYLETKVDGVPAWKVNSQKLRDRIFSDSVDFLLQLSSFTKKPVLLQGDKLLSLFTDDRQRLQDVPSIDSGFKERILQLIDTLMDRLINREICLVASHGDYGYGNILVDPASGVLKGVIDWDTGRKDDLPGIDFINLLVQKERAERNCSPLDAFFAVVKGGLTGVELKYLAEMGVSGDFIAMIVNLAFIRYMSRSSQYPQVFQREQHDYEAILALLQIEMPL